MTLFLRDHKVTVRDQVGQDVERLRLQRHAAPATAQLEQRRVERQVVEHETPL